jgi:hypothetical protein
MDSLDHHGSKAFEDLKVTHENKSENIGCVIVLSLKFQFCLSRQLLNFSSNILYDDEALSQRKRMVVFISATLSVDW